MATYYNKNLLNQSGSSVNNLTINGTSYSGLPNALTIDSNNNVVVSNNLTVNGVFNLSKSLIVDTSGNQVIFGNTTASTAYNNGAVLVSGGLGVGGAINSNNIITAQLFNTNNSNQSVAIVPSATEPSLQGTNCVSIGYAAGEYSQSNNAVAVGEYSGTQSQGINSVAVGAYAGSSNQGSNATAIGFNAGYNLQSNNGIAIGPYAGASSQSGNSVAIGPYAGQTTQGQYSVAIGEYAASANQASTSVAIGKFAGQTNQSGGIAIGYFAGQTSQGNNGTAIGYAAAQQYQQPYGVALGNKAGQFSQGGNSIAIGYAAGQTNQHGNTVVLNATGFALNTTTAASTYIAPLRYNSGAQTYFMNYNPTTSEVYYTDVNNANASGDYKFGTVYLSNIRAYNGTSYYYVSPSLTGYWNNTGNSYSWSITNAGVGNFSGNVVVGGNLTCSNNLTAPFLFATSGITALSGVIDRFYSNLQPTISFNSDVSANNNIFMTGTNYLTTDNIQPIAAADTVNLYSNSTGTINLGGSSSNTVGTISIYGSFRQYSGSNYIYTANNGVIAYNTGSWSINAQGNANFNSVISAMPITLFCNAGTSITYYNSAGTSVAATTSGTYYYIVMGTNATNTKNWSPSYSNASRLAIPYNGIYTISYYYRLSNPSSMVEIFISKNLNNNTDIVDTTGKILAAGNTGIMSYVAETTISTTVYLSTSDFINFGAYYDGGGTTAAGTNSSCYSITLIQRTA